MRKKRVARNADLGHDGAMIAHTLQRIAAAIEHLAWNVERQPRLAELAQAAGLSPAKVTAQLLWV